MLINVIFNKIQHELFFWRLKIERPDIIFLGIDTIVLDNNGARKRECSETTYKKKKGFQPLHICWGSFLIDVLFQKGSAHSNHGNDYTQRAKAVVELIRKRYSEEVSIILCADSGFPDQKGFEYFEEKLKIHYITTSKIYPDVKEYVMGIASREIGVFKKNKAEWGYIEFRNKLKS